MILQESCCLASSCKNHASLSCMKLASFARNVQENGHISCISCKNARVSCDLATISARLCQIHASHACKVHDHSESSDPNRPPLRMVVSGTAGTGKSYLIQCLKLLLKDRLCVAAPTGVAAFNVDGYTFHSLLSLPVKGDFKPLEGKRLQTIQQTLAAVDYIIIDEMSMVGRKMFGQVDRRLRQVFPE